MESVGSVLVAVRFGGEAMIVENVEKVGTSVECVVCGLMKKPRGRSAPAAMAGGLCDRDCRGYELDPQVGSLWPGETRKEFGY